MKYQKEFDESKTKEDFIRIMRKRKKVKKATALRRWYDYKKYKPKKKEEQLIIELKDVESLPLRGEHPLEERTEHKLFMRKPDIGKMLMFNDMKRYNMNVTPRILYKYGFKDEEVNWLKQEGLI